MTASVAYFDWDSEAIVKGTTFKWTFPNTIKATVKGSKVAMKAPKKTGNYKFSVKAYDKKRNLLKSEKFTLTVKKNPGAKIIVRNMDSNKSLSSVKKGQEVMIDLKNATFGWDNNKKKDFYTWTVKQGGTTAKWNFDSGNFKSNKIVGGAAVWGGLNPVIMGAFKQKGTYKITATIYHSDKKIQTVTKTIKVK